jgi:peptidoglycan/xylan/chitin deacetylase (PgdA/CDA1 family)
MQQSQGAVEPTHAQAMRTMTNHHNPATIARRSSAPARPTPEARPLAEARSEREQHARDRRRRRLRQKRLRRLLLLCLIVVAPVLLASGISRRPVKVTVGDRAVWAWGSRNVAYAVRKSGVTPPHGNLVDVRGDVLAPGDGRPAIPLADGQPVSYGATVREHRKITFEPGADLREPLTAEATLLASASDEDWRRPWQPEYFSSKASVVGIERTERGALSGRPYLHQTSTAVPLQPGAGQPVHIPKCLALTFDDGPNGATTREVLGILNANGAHATFFLLADCVHGQEALVREAVAAGHEIGNHSWGHKQMTRLGVQGALANIARAEKIIRAASGRRCRWFRPPYGDTNAAIRKAILDAGYNIALWSCDTNDWQRPGAETIYRRIIAGAKPGAIILMHDGGPREQTVAAVRRAVPELIRMGYALVTLSEMAAQTPRDDAGMTLTTDVGTWTAHLPEEPIHVSVNGNELSSPGPILVIGGSVLLPAPAILKGLSADWSWDTEGQVVTVSSLRGTFRFRLNSPLVSWDDREVRMDVPPVLYHDTPLVPAQALARAAGARLDEQASPRSFGFVSLEPIRVAP